MTLLGLDHVQLSMPMGGEGDARAYYAEVLGMTEEPKPPALAARGGCWFRAGAVALHLGAEGDFRPARKAHPAVRVDDLDALAARLAARGLAVRWSDEVPGVRRFHTDDPFGNRLEFVAA
ncbi:MAG: glyoxalase [Myxococcaceae bacterium]|nr:glyoxalase [Myxococcaceae bacterium]